MINSVMTQKELNAHHRRPSFSNNRKYQQYSSFEDWETNCTYLQDLKYQKGERAQVNSYQKEKNIQSLKDFTISLNKLKYKQRYSAFWEQEGEGSGRPKKPQKAE